MKSYLSLDTEAKLKKKQALPPHIHFIGIGGIGMSGLAMILAKKGYSISGSDQKKSKTLEELAENNVRIFETQEESNIDEILKISSIFDSTWVGKMCTLFSSNFFKVRFFFWSEPDIEYPF